jgi:hypothetical protein
MLTAAQMAQRYADAMASTQTKKRYQEGIAAVTSSPMAAAATDQAMRDYADKVAESISSGYRKRKLEESSFPDWKTNAGGVGADRLPGGALKGKKKVDRHFGQFASAYQQASDAAAAASGPLEKVRAAINALKAAAGKPPI